MDMMTGYVHTPSYRAMLEVTDPEYTSVCLLVDKEEIGSVGASGMQSRFFENCVAEVMNLAGEYTELAVRRAMKNSKVLLIRCISGFRSKLSISYGKEKFCLLWKRTCIQ